MNSKPHTRLEAWRVAMDLVEEVYKVTGTFPVTEQYTLTAQMRRAAISIPSNIAEGAARNTGKEFCHFVSIARGSLSELDTQFQIAKRLGYIQTEENIFEVQLEQVSKLVSGLHKKLKETA